MQRELLIEIVAGYPEGISRAEIGRLYRERTGEGPAPRTLQRWLADLVEEGVIQKTGRVRSTRYSIGQGEHQPSRQNRAPTTGTTVEIPPHESAERGSGISQEELQEITHYLQQPVERREPVGYHREFLEDYEPGITWYLPESVRDDLREIGRTPVPAAPAGTYAREILARLLIDLSWASSRLEGNTYSWLDTRRLLDFGLQAEGHDAEEAQMIFNHRSAIEMLVAAPEDVGFNSYTMRNLQAALMENLLDDPSEEGRLRLRAVEIGGSAFMPLNLPSAIEELFLLLLEKVERIPDPFEQSIFMMVQLPYLQPFVDGNKRVSRLAANLPLIRENLSPLSFLDIEREEYVRAVLAVYELNRPEPMVELYRKSYRHSAGRYRVVRDSFGDPDPFRLRYRREMVETLVKIVRDGEPPEEAGIRARIPPKVEADDRTRFIFLTLQELLNLHEGNIARYGLRPAEFRRWREMWG